MTDHGPAERHQVPRLDHATRQLQHSLEVMSSVNRDTQARLVATSSNPALMERAFRALEPGEDALAGREALRLALRSDGVADDLIVAIDALYVRCAVGWT